MTNKTGWFNESARHALAAKGIETARKTHPKKSGKIVFSKIKGWRKINEQGWWAKGTTEVYLRPMKTDNTRFWDVVVITPQGEVSIGQSDSHRKAEEKAISWMRKHDKSRDKELHWKSVHDAPVEKIRKEFKQMYGKYPTSDELNDIILEGKW